MHVLVHEVQNGEPEGSKGGQGQQRREMLEEDLEQTQESQSHGSLVIRAELMDQQPREERADPA